MCKNTHFSWNFLLHHNKISPISSSLAVLKLIVTVIKSIRIGKQTGEEREYKIVPNVQYNCTQCSVHLYSMFSTFVLNIVYIKYFALFQQIPLVLITFAQCYVDFIKVSGLFACAHQAKAVRFQVSGFTFQFSDFRFHINTAPSKNQEILRGGCAVIYRVSTWAL